MRYYDDKALIQELCRLRLSLGITRKEICQNLENCSERSLWNWEETQAPSPYYREKIVKLVSDMQKIENGEASVEKFLPILLEELTDPRKMYPKARGGLPGGSEFMLWRGTRLSHLRTICAGDEYTDSLIFEGLERLASEGRIKIWRIRARDLGDFEFSIELGLASRDHQSNVIGKIKIDRMYEDKPILDSERDKHCLVKISEICVDLERRRVRHFEERYGKASTVEGDLIHADWLDAVEAGRRKANLEKAMLKVLNKEKNSEKQTKRKTKREDSQKGRN